MKSGRQTWALTAGRILRYFLSMTTDTRQMLTVRVPRDLHRSLRIRAIEEDRQVQDLVADAIAAYLAKPAPKPSAAKKAAAL